MRKTFLLFYYNFYKDCLNIFICKRFLLQEPPTKFAITKETLFITVIIIFRFWCTRVWRLFTWPKQHTFFNPTQAINRCTLAISTCIHGESKKGDTVLLSISLLNIDRFSQFFHRRTQLKLCNKIINKDPTSTQMCCYTTLWNVPTRQCTSAQGMRDNQAATTGDTCIHLTWSVASE